ncbi:MAG: rhomboid family intramembrane serine protease [Polyangiales bacterium]
MFQFPPLTPFVKKLLIVLFGVYLLQVISVVWLDFPLTNYLALHPGSTAPTSLLGIFTHVFAEEPGAGSVFSILLAIVFLWWMLCPFEARFGAKRTAQLCAIATLGASVPTFVLGFVFPNATPVLGSSPLWLAIIAASSWMMRFNRVSLFGVFDMKAKA